MEHVSLRTPGTQSTADIPPSLHDTDLTFSAAAPRAGAPFAPAPLVLVLPGGAYSSHAEHEGKVIADWLSTLGLNALVIRYPVAPHQHPQGLERVQRVLSAARNGTLGLDIDRQRIAVMGFSAGGHLAALVSAGMDTGRFSDVPRVDLSILAYPVISFVQEPHEGSVNNLLGSTTSPESRASLSAESLVTAQTPPTFLWHAADDGAVTVGHSLRYASALAAHNVPFDLHVFERGEHGKGLATGLGPLEAWASLCSAWLAEHGWLAPRD